MCDKKWYGKSPGEPVIIYSFRLGIESVKIGLSRTKMVLNSLIIFNFLI